MELRPVRKRSKDMRSQWERKEQSQGTGSLNQPKDQPSWEQGKEGTEGLVGDKGVRCPLSSPGRVWQRSWLWE